ncbi:MAG: hypothetical protein GYA68_08845 [Syntrophorhabdus sp.]|nr:hypothetical protein [Syntrophorhabdus sp.]
MNPKNDPLQIPYRLETPEDVIRAMEENLLCIGKNYQRILLVSKLYPLSFPPAYEAARKEARKDFFRVRKDKIREVSVEFEEIESLNLISGFESIENQVPWLKGILEHRDIFSFIKQMPDSVQKRCRLSSFQSNPSTMVESFTAIRRLLKQELLSYVLSKKTKSVSLDEMKRFIGAYVIFGKSNRDVYEALKLGLNKNSENHIVLYQNACAEILFARIPTFISELIILEPDTIRQKVFSKIAKLDIRPKQCLGLYSYFPMGLPGNKVVPALKKMSQVAMRMAIADDVKTRFHDYIKVMSENIENRQSLYTRLFLNKELEKIQRLYVPRDVMKYHVSYRDVIRATYTEKTTILFYPTKDYMDLFHGTFSSDCVGLDLAQKHLTDPAYFNIRIFKNGRWKGNIYMLDLTDRGILMVDRIQIPRSINAEYMQFFKSLKEVFQEMFSKVDYDEILIPLTISNHDIIQRVFNKFKDGLQKRWINFDTSRWCHFESIVNNKKQEFCVLCKKVKTN